MTAPMLIRSHEIMDLKRCPKKWYWKWRLGLTPKAKSFSALDLGTWVHDALAAWYSLPPKARTLQALLEAYRAIVYAAIHGSDAPTYVIDNAHELAKLGLAMLRAYAEKYQGDRAWDVIGAEIPLEIEITGENHLTYGRYRLKLDLAVRDRTTGKIWIIEHKTAKVIRIEHLTIDGQARPYGALAELAMKRVGILAKGDRVAGILYNYLRKAVPDMRDVDAKGLALNKDGTISKRQPVPLFRRHPVTLTNKAKLVALKRIRRDVILLTELRGYLMKHRDFADKLSKTPHSSCPKFCDYFAMCELEEQGGDISKLRRGMFVRQNPYTYETTDEAMTFEMG